MTEQYRCRLCRSRSAYFRAARVHRSRSAYDGVPWHTTVRLSGAACDRALLHRMPCTMEQYLHHICPSCSAASSALLRFETALGGALRLLERGGEARRLLLSWRTMSCGDKAGSLPLSIDRNGCKEAICCVPALASGASGIPPRGWSDGSARERPWAQMRTRLRPPCLRPSWTRSPCYQSVITALYQASRIDAKHSLIPITAQYQL